MNTANLLKKNTRERMSEKNVKTKVLDQFRFSFLSFMKVSSYVFYPTKLEWIKDKPEKWDDVSLILVLNHTSLFEVILGVALPFGFLKEISKKLIIPVAEDTMKKPLCRFFFSHLAPKSISLTRKRDDSWKHFLNKIEKNDICIFMPEGRMKRLNGLDKNGMPMTVKTGVYDLLLKYQSKKMVIVYSKGLHHIYAPGQKIPRIFKSIKLKAESVFVDDYLDQFKHEDKPWKSVAKDLENRRDQRLSEFN